MSYTSLDAASRDQDLQARVIACTVQEAHNNPTLRATPFGATVRSSPAAGARLVWPVALATEQQYEYALGTGVENPGADEGVISDDLILAAVQTNWPST